MSHQINSVLSYADTIRNTLGKHGAMSRFQLVCETNLDRSVINASLYRLKKQGEVIEKSGVVMLARGAV